MLAFGTAEGGLTMSPASTLTSVLESRFGRASSVDELAAEMRDMLASLCRRLAELVGESGIAAVLHRSIAGQAAPQPWPERIDALERDLVGLDLPGARAQAERAMASFVGAVLSLLGERLTLQVMHELWPETGESP